MPIFGDFGSLGDLGNLPPPPPHPKSKGVTGRHPGMGCIFDHQITAITGSPDLHRLSKSANHIRVALFVREVVNSFVLSILIVRLTNGSVLSLRRRPARSEAKRNNVEGQIAGIPPFGTASGEKQAVRYKNILTVSC